MIDRIMKNIISLVWGVSYIAFKSKNILLAYTFMIAVFSSCTGKAGDSGSGSEAAMSETKVYEGIGAAEHAGQCDSCLIAEKEHEIIKFHYFVSKVYEPAMKNPKVSPGNKAFLKQLKYYLECSTDSCNREDGLIRTVYRDGDNIQMISPLYYRIADEYLKRDTVLTKEETQSVYRIAYSNSAKINKHKVDTLGIITKVCSDYRAYHFFVTDSTDTLRPAFATTFDLDLEFVIDRTADSLLYSWMLCDSWCGGYCDDTYEQKTFAMLRNVPGLYFTANDPNEYFPARGIFMNVENRYALLLWRFSIDKCSCI
jgi:hypothetical protein